MSTETATTTPIQIPILRAGKEYESLDKNQVKDPATGEVLAEVGQANAGIIRRDLKRIGDKARTLREVPIARMMEICKEAGKHFMESTLPLNQSGETQTPEQYVATLSRTSGLPHVLVRRNMAKIFTVFDTMPQILGGLMRGMPLSVVEEGFGEHSGIPVCYGPTTDSLGVVLPSNSPGVNSIWMPAVALRVPVVLKPGREEPWTPLRIMAAFMAAGCPPEAFSFYPTTHEGAATILQDCGRALLFGDENTTKTYADNPAIELHGPGRSKVLIGEDTIDDWRELVPVLLQSVAANGGRSCINASSIFVPRHGAEIAEALAQEMAKIEPTAPDSEEAKLSSFANPKFAEWIDASIQNGIEAGGAEDVTAKHREGPRAVEHSGAQFLRPTVIRCDSVDHPLAATEFLFPFTSVVEVPQDQMIDKMGYSLVVSAITKDEGFIEDLLASPNVDRLNIGPVPTSHVEWDQPHEGNLFEFLFARRAIQRADGW